MIIHHPSQWPEAIAFVSKFINEKFPQYGFDIKVERITKKRSLNQNALSHKWYAQIAKTLREDDPAGVKRYCKYTYGLPILRTDEEFNDWCVMVIDPLTYEQRIASMEYVDVTSIMKTNQMSEYMKAVQQGYAGRVDLQFPSDMAYEEMARRVA